MTAAGAALPASPTGAALWCLAVRPKTLSISVAPVLAGTAIAWGESGAFQPLAMAVALLAAILIQAGTNLYNDVADALRGGDQHLRIGPARVTANNWASPDSVRNAARLCFGLAAMLGLYLGAIGGPAIIALGLASLAAGWAYSCGPHPISHTPWGEAVVVAFFGMGAVAGTAWLHAGVPVPGAVATGIAVGLPAAAILLVNNTRDIKADRLVGRRTLAILIGPHCAGMLYAVLLLAPFLLAASPHAPKGAWLALLAAPEALRLCWAFFRPGQQGGYNLILASTARFQLIFAALLLLGSLL